MTVPLTCPLCGDNMEHRKFSSGTELVDKVTTHAYFCESCPLISFEYINDQDYINLKKLIV